MKIFLDSYCRGIQKPAAVNCRENVSSDETTEVDKIVTRKGGFEL